MATRTARADTSVHVRLVNPHGAAVQLVLEPWGETYTIAPDDAVDVEVRGPAGETLEIAHEPQAIVVWAWPGSTLQVFRGAEELGSVQGRPPVPRPPADERADGAATSKNGARRSETASRTRSVRPSTGKKQ